MMRKKDYILLAGSSILCILFMLPRILSAQFGLLDDGVLLLNAESALKDLNLIWFQYQSSGRFIPTVLLQRALFFAFAGYSAERWYILVTLQLIILTFIVIFVAHNYKASRIQITICVVLFLASPSLVENFYTLSKSEIPLLIFIAGAILLANYYPRIKNRFLKILSVLGTFVFLIMGAGAKETIIILPFIFLSWYLASRLIIKNSSEYKSTIQTELILLFCSVASCIVYWLLRNLFGITMPASNSYVSGYQLFDFSKIMVNLASIIGWIIRDYPYLIPVLLSFLVIRPLRQSKNFLFAIKWGIWMIAWAGILLPWIISAYYLLVFSFGAALLSGIIIGQMIQYIGSGKLAVSSIPNKNQPSSLNKGNRFGIAVITSICLLLIIPPAINASAYAKEQLLYDKANGDFIENIVKLPENSRVIVVLPERTEYYYEINVMINRIHKRDDIVVEPYQSPIQINNQDDVYIASLFFENQIFPGPRVIHGPSLMVWSACVENELIASKKEFSTIEKRPIIDIGLHRLLPFLHMTDALLVNRPVFVSTESTYGWNVVEFVPPLQNYSKPGVYQNGVFTIQTVSGNVRSVRFGNGTEIPFSGDIDGDGYSDLVLYDRNSGKWTIDNNLDGLSDMVYFSTDVVPDAIPLLGDWDGDGKKTPGYFHPQEAEWFLFNDFSENLSENYSWGMPSDVPIVGDWDGDGKEEIGLYRTDTGYTSLTIDLSNFDKNIAINGLANADLITGLWEATPRSQIAYVKNETWTIFSPIPGCVQPNSLQEYQYNYPGNPISGIWPD